jgi:sarcosine oxidase
MSCCCTAPTNSGRAIERVSGEKLLYKVGSIDAGPADSWVFKGSFQSAVAMGIDHEVLTGIELSQRFPGYRLPQEIMALYQKDGGFLTPERCVVSYVNAALARRGDPRARDGAGLGAAGRRRARHHGSRRRTPRTRWSSPPARGTASSCPGSTAWPRPELQVLIWMQPERPEYFRLDNFPVFNCLVDEGRFYGFPVFGVPGFKFGKYHHFEEQGRPPRDQTRAAARR